jgi:hypothetical protein
MLDIWICWEEVLSVAQRGINNQVAVLRYSWPVSIVIILLRISLFNYRSMSVMQACDSALVGYLYLTKF